MNKACLRGPLAIAALTLVCSCGSYPLPKVYVLGNPGAATPQTSSDRESPRFFLPRASVPDYLDTTEIIRRSGANQLIASPTGIWGVRVSVGVTEALDVALAQQLPGAVIETHPSSASERRILVEVERFELRLDGSCILQARWEVTGVDGAARGWSAQATVIETASPADDAGAAAAMTRAADQVAEKIAVTIRQELSGAPPRPVP